MHRHLGIAVPVRHLARWLAATAVGLALAACGGGEGDDLVGGGGGGPTLLSWNGSVNGSTVKDADNDAFAFTTDRVLYRNGTSYPGVKVASDATINWNGSTVGAVVLAAAQGGGQLAVVQCSDGSTMDLSFGSSVSYSCAGTSNSGGGNNTGGGNNNTGGNNTGGDNNNGSTPNYITITGSGNGVCILDNSNDCFAFDATTGHMSFLGTIGQVNVDDTHATPSRTYANTQVVYRNGLIDGLAINGVYSAAIRKVGLTNGQTGAALICNGSYYSEISEDPSKPGDAVLTCSTRRADLR